MRDYKALARKILTWSAIAALVYFGNVRVQTWLGERALAGTGLTVHTLEEGLSLAASSDRLVLADVSAIWCGRCRNFDNAVLADPSVRAAIEANFVFVRVEYESEEGKAFSARYEVTGFPRLLILDAEGNLLQRLPTVYEPGAFRAMLEGAS